MKRSLACAGLLAAGLWTLPLPALGQSVGTFVKTVGYGVADGSPVLQTCTENCLTGIWGDAPGQLRNPLDIHVGPGGLIYVAAGVGVTVYSPQGDFIRVVGEAAPAVSFPHAVDVDAAGDIYIAGGHSHLIHRYAPDGTFVRAYGDGLLYSPQSVAVAPDGSVYAGDLSHRVFKFAADGTLIFQVGQEGSGPGEFRRPQGLDIASDGRIYVADWFNGRVQVLGPDGSLLEILGDGDALDELIGSPFDLTLTPDDSLVLPRSHVEIVVLDSSYQLVARFGEMGMGAGQFLGQGLGVAFAPPSTIWASDAMGARISEFTLEPACDPPPGALLSLWDADHASATDAFDLAGPYDMMLGGVSFEPGPVGLGFEFDGDDDDMVAYTPTLDSYTYSVWLEHVPGPDVEQAVLTQGVGPGNNCHLLRILHSSFIDAIGQSGGHPFAVFDPAVNRHIVLTNDPVRNQSALYIDGEFQVSDDAISCTQAGLNFLRVGRSVFNGHNGDFSGRIDDLQLYDRPLRPSEIQALYAAGPKGTCRDSCTTSADCAPGQSCGGELCESTAPVCGNGVIEVGEICDGTTFSGGDTCDSHFGDGYSGTLQCSADCEDYEVTTCDSSTCTPPALAPGTPMHWWTMDDFGDPISARDVAQGADANFAALPVHAQGVVGSGLLFDGDGDRGIADIAHEFYFTSLWARSDPGGKPQQVLFSHDVGGANDCLTLRYEPGTQQLSVTAQEGDPIVATVDLSTERHIATRIDPVSALMELYVDGVMVGTPSFLWCFQPFNGRFYLGGAVATSAFDFKGMLDEVTLWSWLTPDGIAELYQAGAAGVCKAP